MHPEEQHPTSKHRAFKLSKRGPPTFFHSDINLVLGNALAHPFEKKTVLVVTVELIWLLFFNILSFNFIQTPNKSLRFRKFRRRNVHHGQSCAAFFGWCALSKVSTFLFLQLFVPNNSAFAQPIFVEHTSCSNVVNSKVGKQKEACDIIIHSSWR